MLEIDPVRRGRMFNERLGVEVSETFGNQEAFDMAFSVGIDATIEELGLDPPFEVNDIRREQLATEGWSSKWNLCQGVSLESIVQIAFLDAIKLTLKEANRRRGSAS